MKIKITLTILLLLSLFAKKSFAQNDYFFSLGLSGHSFNIYGFKGNAYSATISSRYTALEISEDVNLSLGTHASMGMSFWGNSTGLFLEAPMLAEINIGHGAYQESSNDFGGFIGGGYCQNVLTFEDNQIPRQIFTGGLYLNGGAKFYMGSRSYGVRLSYMKDGAARTDIFGISLMYNFGEFVD